jgi:hypothetical protein
LPFQFVLCPTRSISRNANAGIEWIIALSQYCLTAFRVSERMLHRMIIIAAMLLSSLAGDPVRAQEAIGTVSRIQGEASGTRGGAT